MERRPWKRRREERVASGLALGERITLVESRCIIGLPFPPWMGSLRAYGESSLKYFYQRKSEDKFFDELVHRYGLKEVEEVLVARALKPVHAAPSEDLARLAELGVTCRTAALERMH